jgi:hypothetical protein
MTDGEMGDVGDWSAVQPLDTRGTIHEMMITWTMRDRILQGTWIA